jgi:large subunit ribosomal protein L9
MKVVLLEDIENLGKKYEIKEVKDGHARNFLIPKGLVKMATREVVEWASMQKEITEKRAEEDLGKIQKVATEMDGLEVAIQVKLGEKDQLFEKITEQKISEKLKEMGFNIKKAQITMENPIEEIGEFPVKIKFEHNLETEITVIVAEEKQK